MKEITLLMPDRNENEPRLLDAKETAKRIGLSISTIYARTSKKREATNPVKCDIPRYRRNGGRILFLESDVDEFVKGASNGTDTLRDR